VALYPGTPNTTSLIKITLTPKKDLTWNGCFLRHCCHNRGVGPVRCRPGSFFGNGFEVFLAENIIRYPEKTTMEYSVIGHLHIMLALICIMITLIIGRWLNFKGLWHKFAMPLMILARSCSTSGYGAWSHRSNRSPT